MGYVIGLIVFGIVVLVYRFMSDYGLPSGVDDMIRHALESPLPELIKGETGYADSNGLKIFYESIIPNGKVKRGIVTH